MYLKHIFFTDNSSNATETETASDVPKIVVTVIFFVFIVVASVIVSRLVNRYIENRKNSISDFEEIDRTDIIVMSRLAYMQRKRSTIVRNKHEGAKKDKEKNNTNVYTTANSKIFEEIEVSSDNGSALEKAKSTPKVETKSKKQINTTLQPIFELPIPEKKPSSDRVIKTAIIEPKTKVHPDRPGQSKTNSIGVTKQTLTNSPKNISSLEKSKTTLVPSQPPAHRYRSPSPNVHKSNTAH